MDETVKPTDEVTDDVTDEVTDDAPASRALLVAPRPGDLDWLDRIAEYMRVLVATTGRAHFDLRQHREWFAPGFDPADLAPWMIGPFEGVDPATFLLALGIVAGADVTLTTETNGISPLDVVAAVVPGGAR